MNTSTKWQQLVSFTLAGMILLIASAGTNVQAYETLHRKHPPYTQLAIHKPQQAAIKQVVDLLRQHNFTDARLLGEMLLTPQAAWIVGSTPEAVARNVRKTVNTAAALGTVPVLVAYNIPFRDCAQFSAGGATTLAEYTAWINGFAAGLPKHAQAIVILEPDSLGIIPWYTNLDGNLEWCQPAEADPVAAAAERFAMLNYAVDVLAAKPNVKVYLDGTHSGWLAVGDVADRLAQAGVDRADGFFLNVSNYQYTHNLSEYGKWIASCIAYATEVVLDGFSDCPNQYWNGGPLPAKVAELFGEWMGTALSPFGEWSDESTIQTLNTSGINLRYSNMLGAVTPKTHFVIDTSRNGRGPWQPTASYPDPQTWCNPPGLGLGVKPTLFSVAPLVDAYLWVKIPGESDGSCTRGLGPVGTVDPEWGRVDPPAGGWFPEMALELARNAVPPLH